MYFDEAGTSGGAVFPAGIYKGAIFNGMYRNQDWWELSFSSPEGHSITKYLNTPTGQYPYGEETPEDALQREADDNIRYVVKALRVVAGDEIASSVATEDYESFMAQSASILLPLKGTLVNLKILPNAKKPEFTDLPRRASRYPLYSYIERYEEGEEPKLKFTKRELALLNENGITQYGQAD